MTPVGRRARVYGRVQGVSFRAWTQMQARKLGVSGYACNLADGSVEVLACGDAAAVEALCAWLWQGSPQAAVSAVEIESVEAVPLDGFVIR